MDNSRKKIWALVFIIALICVLGITREIYWLNIESKNDSSSNAQIQERRLSTESLDKISHRQPHVVPKAIRSKVDALISRARRATNQQDFDGMVDFYYDAVLLEPEILGKWNKARYIGAELDIIKRVRKDIYLHNKGSDDARDKLMKINYILSEWYKGCKK